MGRIPEKKKKLKLAAEHIKVLAPDLGACFATDLVTCKGLLVGYMYREKPDFEDDSGWRFLAGTETQDYMDQADNHGIYDCNTLANYDPSIILFLNKPIGSAFYRDEKTNQFVTDQNGAPNPDEHADNELADNEHGDEPASN